MHAKSWNSYRRFLIGYKMGGLGGSPPRIWRNFESQYWIRANLGAFRAKCPNEISNCPENGGQLPPVRLCPSPTPLSVFLSFPHSVHPLFPYDTQLCVCSIIIWICLRNFNSYDEEYLMLEGDRWSDMGGGYAYIFFAISLFLETVVQIWNTRSMTGAGSYWAHVLNVSLRKWGLSL